MKKFLLVFSILFSITFNLANAQSNLIFFEEQNYYSEKGVSPLGFVWASHYFENSQWGTFCFALVSPNWGEIMAGPNYTFKIDSSILEVGAGIGFETDDTPIRGMLYSLLIMKKTTVYLNGEYGGSGYWYLGYATRQISKLFTAGIHAQYGNCWGPRLEFHKGPLMIYSAGGYNVEGKEMGAISGVRLTF